jgi:hypothetical protein
MHRIPLPVFAALAFLALSPERLLAGPIGSATLTESGGGRVVADRVKLTLAFGSVLQGTALPAFEIIVGAADAGRTFSLTAGPVFEAATRALTDGVDGGVGFFYTFDLGGTFGSGATRPEAVRFFGNTSGVGRVDFAGFEITSLTFRVDGLALDSPGRDPNRDGVWTDIAVGTTLTVNGHVAATTVPEPATLWLAAAGAAIVPLRAFRTRLMRRRPVVRTR